METIGKQLAESFLQIILTAGALAFIGKWMFGAQIKTLVASAVSAAELERLKEDVAGLKAEIDELKEEMKEMKGNYISRFEGLGEHITRQIDRVLEKMEADRKVVSEIQRTCAANHGVMQ